MPEQNKLTRKDFLRRSCQCGAASILGLFAISGKPEQAEEEDCNKELKNMKWQIDHSQKRFADLLKHMEQYIDKELRLSLYQKVGEDCAMSFSNSLNPYKDDLSGFIAAEKEKPWIENIEVNKGMTELTLSLTPIEDCGCPLLTKSCTPSEYCNCSVGFMRKRYQVITNNQVDVELLGSVLMGDPQCSFKISIG